MKTIFRALLTRKNYYLKLLGILLERITVFMHPLHVRDTLTFLLNFEAFNRV